MKDKSSASNLGAVLSVRGSVVDIRFDEHLPPIYSVLHAGGEGKIVIEVLAQLDVSLVATVGEPDLPESCCGGDLYDARHSTGDMVGKRSSKESHTHRDRPVGDVAGSVGRADTAVTKRVSLESSSG